MVNLTIFHEQPDKSGLYTAPPRPALLPSKIAEKLHSVGAVLFRDTMKHVGPYGIRSRGITLGTYMHHM